MIMHTCLVTVSAAQYLRRYIEGAAHDGFKDLPRPEVSTETEVGSLQYAAVVIRRQQKVLRLYVPARSSVTQVPLCNSARLLLSEPLLIMLIITGRMIIWGLRVRPCGESTLHL